MGGIRTVPRSALAALAAALLLVPGCLSAKEEPVQQGTLVVNETTGAVTAASGTEGAPVADAVPLWAVGDFWEYRTTGGAGSSMTLVVARASATEYQLLTTDNETSTFDGALDISYIGPIGAKDLSGRQGDAPVKFFQFPLVDGATWKTTWDGEERTVTATAASVKTPLGDAPGFALSAKDAKGAEKVRYAYAPTVRWITRMEFLESNTTTYGIELTRMGHDFKGTALQAEGRTLSRTSTNAGAGSSTSTLTLAPEDQTLFVVYAYGGTAEAFGGVLLDPQNGKHDLGAKPVDVVIGGGAGALLTIPAIPGQWRYSIHHAGVPTQSDYLLWFLAVRVTAVAVG